MARKITTMRLRAVRMRNPMEMSGIQNGRDITRPWIGPLLEPTDPILRARGGGSFDIYKPILTDPQVKSVMTQRLSAVTSREWEVVPGEDTAQGRRAADWLRAELSAMRFDRLTEKMLWGLFYGYAVAEQMFRRDGRLWGWEDIRVRDRVRFRFDEDCGLRLLTMSDMLTGEEMPGEKFWVFSTGADHDDEPYGLGLAHWLYWPVWFKRNGLKLWLIALDKFGMPTARGKYQSGASEEDQQKLLEAVMAIRSEAGIIIPEGMDIELLSAQGGSSRLDYRALHDTMDAAISKIVLSQTMTTDDGSSRSQAEVHADVADAVKKADADLVCQSFNEGPVARLSEFNFPGVTPPKVWRRMDDPEDTSAAVDRDSKLHAMGWQMTKDRVKETYGDGYERAAPGPGPDAPPEFAEHVHDSALDDLAEQIIAEGHAEAAATALFSDIAAFLEGIGPETTLDELRARLDGLRDVPGDSRALVDLLTEASFAARLAGELGAVVDDEETPGGEDSLPGAVSP
jgi:phage gp29-like protein